MQSITIQRNAQITGRNSKSYNDKHPENPIQLRPIRTAREILRLRDTQRWVLRTVRSRSRPELAEWIEAVRQSLE